MSSLSPSPSPSPNPVVNEKTTTTTTSNANSMSGRTTAGEEGARRFSSAESQNTATPMVRDMPPPIAYGFMHHRNSILAYVFFVLFCNLAAPCILFYVLRDYTNLSMQNLIGISSAALGLSSCFDSPFRMWKLWKHWDEYGPLGDDKKWHLDSFMWIYSTALTIMAIPLAVASALDPPLEDFFLMTTPMLVGPLGLWFFFSLYPWRLPFRISSDPAGTRIKPAIFYIIEDVGAVDARHGRPYRKALHERYAASPPFQHIMWTQTLFWAVGCVIYVGVTAAVTWTATFGFAFGWVLGQFFVWLLVWAVASVFLYSYGLKRESRWWAERKGEKAAAQIA